MIPRETIRQIVETARIDEVIGDFVSLKKRGINLLGLCPFHNEKTPSFTVSPAKGIFKCFGCGKAGNSVNFIMEHEHYTYPEALRYLAKKYSIEMKEEIPDEEELKQQGEQEAMYNLFGFAGKYFSKTLWETDEGKAIGLSYFEERGFTHPVIQKFDLGYCLNRRDALTDFALNSGYAFEQLQKAGLSSGSAGAAYDIYRERAIFPIHNLTGRIIAFGARILSSDKTKPKYINSPETAIYVKSKVLYGLFQARNAIVKNDTCYLTEGYTDVISMHQAGIENVVASSGTSLTSDQIRLIKRYTQNVVILYDGDPAGIKAAIRGIDMILEEGMNVKIVVFPEGEDPDSFVRKNRTAEVLEFLKSRAADFITFRLELMLEEAQNDPIKKVLVVKDFVKTIAKIPDNLTRISYIKQSCERLDMPEEGVFNELNKLLRKKVAKEHDIPAEHTEEPPLPPQQAPEDENFLSAERIEMAITRLLVSYGNKLIDLNIWMEMCLRAETEAKKGAFSYKKIEIPEDERKPHVMLAAYVIYEMENDSIEFEQTVCRKIFDDCSATLKAGSVNDEHYFANHPDDEVRELCINLSSSQYELANWNSRIGKSVPTPDDTETLSRMVFNALIALRIRHIEIKRHQVQQQLKALKTGEEDEMMNLMKSEKELLQVYARLNKILGRIISR